VCDQTLLSAAILSPGVSAALFDNAHTRLCQSLIIRVPAADFGHRTQPALPSSLQRFAKPVIPRAFEQYQ
jgi:hypothetical protein